MWTSPPAGLSLKQKGFGKATGENSAGATSAVLRTGRVTVWGQPVYLKRLAPRLAQRN